MIENLRKKNPDIEFYDVSDAEFRSFGRVIPDVSTDEIMAVASAMQKPETGVRYLASVEEFEALSIAQYLQNECFGGLPSQTGYCFGHNSLMNATEWHTCSEINIAVTPLVLMLGHVWDIEDNKIASSKFKAFYLPKGTVAEIYATSLHYCPCQVEDGGFGCVVGLTAGTNTPCEVTPKDALITAKNKWLLAHVQNEAKIKQGAVPGITGVNFEIKY